MTIPHLARVRQKLKQPTITDIAGSVREHWRASPVAQQLKPGAKVAVAVGSRGIANLSTIVQATLGFLKEIGTKPFLVAAMGSHGGATAEGQRDLLASYGLTEQALGVEVRTEMQAERIGTNSWGEPVWWDSNALHSDAVLTISRIKPHTDFRGPFESGIVKMLAIGLGKRDGAAQHHRWGFKGLRDMIPESCKVILEKTPFLAGLAVLENAREETAILEVVPRDRLFEREPRLLEQARELLGKIPFAQLDLLVIGEIGKNYSGAGIDPNVVGRLLIEGEPEFTSPRITRICALDLSPESHGNGTGVGIADLCTTRILQQIDPVPFRMNNLTACFLWRSKLPIDFADDKSCLEMGIDTCWQPRLEQLRCAFIPNTLEVAELWVSAPVLEEARGRPDLEVLSPLQAVPFDAAGNVVQETLFPHSVRGRRGK